MRDVRLLAKDDEDLKIKSATAKLQLKTMRNVGQSRLIEQSI